MFHKGLWLKEYKQSKMVLWGFFIFSCYLPAQLYSSAHQLEQMHKLHPDQYLTNLYYPTNFSNTALLQFLFAIVVGSVMIGRERSNQNMEFSLTLPFSRRAHFLTKWGIGATTIFTSLTLNILACLYCLHTTILVKVMQNFFLFYDYLTVLIVLLAVFTFTLLIGYLTGSFASQAVLSFIFLLLPTGLYYLIKYFIEVNWMALTGISYSNASNAISGSSTAVYMTLPMYVTNISIFINDHQKLTNMIFLFIPFCIMITSFFAGMIFSEKPKTEYHGMMLLYSPLERLIKTGAMVCFFLLGGAIASGAFNRTPSTLSDNTTIIAYYIGGVAAAGIAYFIMSKTKSIRYSYRT